MSCIAYVYGVGEIASKQIKELIHFSNHFKIHISPWIFDKEEVRRNLTELVLNPQIHDMKTFLTMSIDNLGESEAECVNVLFALIEQNIQVICLLENIDTNSKKELKEYFSNK